MLLLLSDVHANLPALEAVLEHATRHQYSRVVFLGDAVGYGPHPAEVLKVLRGLNAECIMGNHEQMLLALHGGREMPAAVATHALNWQMGLLRPLEFARIARWPLQKDDTLGETPVRFCHGSPRHMNEYVLNSLAAGEVFSDWKGALAFHGHSHLAGVYAAAGGSADWIHHQQLSEGGSYRLPPLARALLNPGSVGQPRDGNPKASYATYDPMGRNFTVYRVAYDIERTQRDIRAAGLPDKLAARLAKGR